VRLALFILCFHVVFVSWSFVLCFVFPYSGILWQIEEVLTSLLPFLNHGNWDFSSLMRDFFGWRCSERKNRWFCYLRPLKKNWQFWKKNMRFDFYLILKDLDYMSELVLWFFGELWLWNAENHTDNGQGSVPVSDDCPTPLFFLCQMQRLSYCDHDIYSNHFSCNKFLRILNDLHF
jgi:hypothetical protein